MVGMCSCLFPSDDGCIVVCSRLSVFAGNKHRCSVEMVHHVSNKLKWLGEKPFV